MATFYHQTVTFLCPECQTSTTLESVIEMETASPDHASATAQGHPLICASCGQKAKDGTAAKVELVPITHEEFSAWNQTHKENPHISEA